jgi:hypothetical protein
VSADQWTFFGPLDPFEHMVHIVEASYCSHSPFELREDEQLPPLQQLAELRSVPVNQSSHLATELDGSTNLKPNNANGYDLVHAYPSTYLSKNNFNMFHPLSSRSL